MQTVPTNKSKSVALPYHLKMGNCLTSSLQKHFVKSFALIADMLNSVQQPPQDVWLSGEIIRFFLNFGEAAINTDIATFKTMVQYSN